MSIILVRAKQMPDDTTSYRLCIGRASELYLHMEMRGMCVESHLSKVDFIFASRVLPFLDLHSLFSSSVRLMLLAMLAVFSFLESLPIRIG